MVTSLNGMTGALTLVAGTGITITPGSGTLTIDATGGFALQDLSNLTNPTAINTNMIFGPTGSYGMGGIKIKSADDPNGSRNINFLSGATDTVGSGSVVVATGFSNSDASGAVSIFSGGAATISGGVTMTTGDAASQSGDIFLTIGASPIQGNIWLQDASVGTAGHVWTSTNTSGAGAWAAPASSGANTALSNLSTTNINADLLFATTGSGWSISAPTSSIGDPGTPLTFKAGDTAGGGGAGGSVTVQAGNGSSPGSARIIGGNSISGPSAGGNISLATGTGGGGRGAIGLQDGTEGNAGDVWTSIDTSGNGAWTTPTSGANTSLSNLSSTAINVSLFPDATNTRSVGGPSNQWATLSGLRVTSDFSGESMLSGLITSVSGSLPVSGMGIASLGTPTNAFYMITANSAVANATATQSVSVVTGDKSAGTGDSGSVNISTGTSSGGNRGAINMSALYAALPTGTVDPTAPAGSVYYNTGTNKLRLFDNSTWVDLN